SADHRGASSQFFRRYAGDDELDLLDAGALGVDVIGDDLATPHHDDAVYDLEDVVNIVGDEDAGMARVARVSHEAEHPLGLGNSEIVGRLVKDDEIAVEIHRARNRHRLAFAARKRADRRIGRNVLADADLLEKGTRDLVHHLLIEAVQKAWSFHRLPPEKQIACNGK